MKPTGSINGGACEYCISDDRARLDLEVIHGFLSRSYWAAGIEVGKVRVSIENSFCLGAYAGDVGQVGFARVLTDYARFAYLADVFVLEGHRGRGLGKLLVGSALNHPRLKDVTFWLLATRDAHGLYGRFGFGQIGAPERFMVLRRKKSGGPEEVAGPLREEVVMPEYNSGLGDLQVIDRVEVDHVVRALHLVETMLLTRGADGGEAGVTRLPTQGETCIDRVDRRKEEE